MCRVNSMLQNDFQNQSKINCAEEEEREEKKIELSVLRRGSLGTLGGRRRICYDF